MAAKKKEMANTGLPLKVDNDPANDSSITYANEVVAIIAGLAANEVEGIAGMNGSAGNSILSKNRNATKGVRVEVGTEEVGVDLYVTVEYGTPIQRAAMDAQESVRKAIESMTGLHVARVDVHVQGVSFEKENNLLKAGAQSAMLEAGTETETARIPEPKKEQPEEKPAAKKETSKPKAEPEAKKAEPEVKAEPAPEEAPKAEEAKPEEKPQAKPAAEKKAAKPAKKKTKPAGEDGKAAPETAEDKPSEA